jgi:tetratricopeptide (TPR) repeat protein
MRRQVIAPVFALIVLAGCTNRPLHIVLRDADEATRRGEYAAAISDYETYVSRRPDEVDARYRYALALMRAGNPRAAVEQLTICTDVAPLNDAYLDAHAEALFQCGEREALQAILARASFERGRVSDYVRQGHYAVLMGNLDEAQQAFLTASKLDGGKSWELQWELSKFYGALGDSERQIRRLRMAYFLNPNNEALQTEIRNLGQVPGPTFGLIPEEMRQASVPDK